MQQSIHLMALFHFNMQRRRAKKMGIPNADSLYFTYSLSRFLLCSTSYILSNFLCNNIGQFQLLTDMLLHVYHNFNANN